MNKNSNASTVIAKPTLVIEEHDASWFCDDCGGIADLDFIITINNSRYTLGYDDHFGNGQMTCDGMHNPENIKTVLNLIEKDLEALGVRVADIAVFNENNHGLSCKMNDEEVFIDDNSNDIEGQFKKLLGSYGIDYSHIYIEKEYNDEDYYDDN